ncbi:MULTISPECIES: suppressor of fused domain protein [unclassified Streptomyces]|uniref:suppressor of fused domain protein n=1 Tax=unclassified Streptomyces TaxID=2593676 RepID=UPI000B8101DF|nr:MULTISPECIES: suppressor of fused domain protein [unclassified Streptomyces]MYS21870.1 suppressor of fused domain protein [Streptomyces sp. SID4948]
MTEESARLVALERHVRGFWDGHIIEAATWERGPILERVPRFATYRVLPERAGEAWIYVTLGCSLLGPAAGGTEFFVMSPFADEGHSETLAIVGHYHSFEAHRLDIGSVIRMGRPWMRDSRMDHLLVSLPYPYGPGLEWAPPEAGGARFLWLLPIHQSEAEFIRSRTLDEFESLMDARGANVLDPNRDPIV